MPNASDEALAQGEGSSDPVPRPPPHHGKPAHDGGREPGRGAADPPPQRPPHHDGNLRPSPAGLPAQRDRSPAFRYWARRPTGRAVQPFAAVSSGSRGPSYNLLTSTSEPLGSGV